MVGEERANLSDQYALPGEILTAYFAEGFIKNKPLVFRRILRHDRIKNLPFDFYQIDI